MFKQPVLNQQVAIVTGGSRGIGRAIAQLLAEEGAEVVFFYHRNQALAQTFQDESQAKGLKIIGMPVDVSKREECEAAVHTIYEQRERIDILVNNSGIVRDNLLVGLSDEEIRSVIDTNLFGVFHMTQAVVPFMMKQRRGKVINISSVSAEKGGRGQANYAASKGAINAFTKAMAVELAPRKINVNAVAPGIIETDISKTVREQGMEESLAKILLKRFGQPEDVAYAVAFLASPYGDYINGEILHVDGGFKMA